MVQIVVTSVPEAWMDGPGPLTARLNRAAAGRRLFFDGGRVTPHGAASGTSAGSGDPADHAGHWKLVIEATLFVTDAVVNV